MTTHANTSETHWIAPSILSADFARLGEEVDAVLAAGADLIHFDVMDNHYVPNLTIGPLVCEALRKHGVKAPIDVHLMVKPVDRIIPDFAAAGATYISIHPEATEHVDRTLQLIREHGCKAGLVFNPATPLDWLDHVLDNLDLVLVMSRESRLRRPAVHRRSAREDRSGARASSIAPGRPIRLEVDGGVKVDEHRARRRGRRRHVRRGLSRSSARRTTRRRSTRCGASSRPLADAALRRSPRDASHSITRPVLLCSRRRKPRAGWP